MKLSWRRRWGMIGVILVLACPAHSVPVGADTTGEAEVADEAQALVNSLIDDLTGADEAAQKNAAKQLVGIGDPAIGPLQAYLRGGHPPKSKERVQAVLDEAETHFKFRPTLVTIKMHDVHPREVFKELSKQGGIAIQPNWDFWGQNQGYNLPKKISVDIQNQPFWQALMDVSAKAKVGTQNYGQEPHISLTPGGGGAPDGIRYLSGPVLFIASNIDRDVALRANGTSEKRLTLHMQAFVDPRMTMLGNSPEVMAAQVVGDDGGSLAAPWQKQMDPGNGGGLSIGLTTPLLYETGKNTRIATFKGSARFRIGCAWAKVEIPDPINFIGKKAPGRGVDVTLKNFFKNSDGSYEVKIEATWQKPQEEQINWWMITSLHLYDAKGNEYSAQHRGGGGSSTFTELSVHFSRPGSVDDAAKLVWEPVTASRKIQVPVEFKDLPLPVP